MQNAYPKANNVGDPFGVKECLTRNILANFSQKVNYIYLKSKQIKNY